MSKNPFEFTDLVGRTIEKVEGLKADSSEVKFILSDGSVFRMFHEMQGSESVFVADVWGSSVNLEGRKVNRATVDKSHKFNEQLAKDIEKASWEEVPEWTFYSLHTNLGAVVIRWSGESNKYYSVEINCELEVPDAKA